MRIKSLQHLIKTDPQSSLPRSLASVKLSSWLPELPSLVVFHLRPVVCYKWHVFDLVVNMAPPVGKTLFVALHLNTANDSRNTICVVCSTLIYIVYVSFYLFSLWQQICGRFLMKELRIVTLVPWASCISFISYHLILGLVRMSLVQLYYQMTRYDLLKLRIWHLLTDVIQLMFLYYWRWL